MTTVLSPRRIGALVPGGVYSSTLNAMHIATLAQIHSGSNTSRALREVITSGGVHFARCAAAPLFAGRLQANISNLIRPTFDKMVCKPVCS